MSYLTNSLKQLSFRLISGYDEKCKNLSRLIQKDILLHPVYIFNLHHIVPVISCEMGNLIIQLQSYIAVEVDSWDLQKKQLL